MHVDQRGTLVAMDLDRVGHPVARVFVVTDCPAGVERGLHPAPCRETAVLVAGGADFWVGGDRHRLEEAGDRVLIPAGSLVRYTLDDPDSTLLVLAEAPSPPPPRDSSA